MIKRLIVMLSLSFSNVALCCSLTPSEILKQDENYTPLYDSNGYIPIPTPEVVVLSVYRGHKVENGGSSCGDIGGATLKVTFPIDSKHNISDFGFYVQVIEGSAPNDGMGEIPIKLTNVKYNSGEYNMSWVEHDPKPFKAKLILFAVSKNLQISKPRIFFLQHTDIR